MHNDKLDIIINNLEHMEKRFEDIDKHFEDIDKHFEDIDKHFEDIDKHFERIDKRFERIENRLEVLEFKTDRNAEKIDDLQLDVKISNRNINRDLRILKDETDTIVQILKVNELIAN